MENFNYHINEREFIQHFIQNRPQIMWFLGAGTSRSSGLPTAVDLIWDLKRQYYCEKENQDVQAFNITNQGIKGKIQSYFDSMGCPEAWSHDEYSFYFELLFGDNPSAQQSYLQNQLSPEKVTLTIGPRVLASLMAMGSTRLVFSTNFDNVLEDAYSEVSSKSLPTFSLEGSYASLDALNSERFPIYSKIHGDFRYQKLKNLSKDMLSNDEKVQECFIAASGRFGLVISGYSGRDRNVMNMFHKALNQPNPFPQGIWWTVPDSSSVTPNVISFIEEAQKVGVNAHIVVAGPFDLMLYKIWRQIPEKPEALDKKVRTSFEHKVSIPLQKPGNNYPIIRTNALEVLDVPRKYGFINSNGVKASDVFSEIREKNPNAIISYNNGVIFWGDSNQVVKCLENYSEGKVSIREIADPVKEIDESTFLKSFYEHGIAQSLCKNKPVLLRKKDKTYFFVVDPNQSENVVFTSLKKSVGYRGIQGQICGSIRELSDTFWAECISIKLEVRAGVLWLLLEPGIWIKPLVNRKNATDFIINRMRNRYNNQSSEILNAWIEILVGSVGIMQPVTNTYGEKTDFPASFTISNRTAYSKRVSI